MQQIGTAAGTALYASVEKSMGKRGDVSSETRERSFKHAAPVEQVLAVKDQVEAIGWGWHDAVADAGVSRNVGYTLLRGEGSVGSLRTIEEWLRKKQVASGGDKSETPQETWARLGEDLAVLGDEQLGEVMESLKEYVSAEKRRRAAFSKLLRITPDHRK